MRAMIRAFVIAHALLWSSVASSYPVIVGIEGYVTVTFFNPSPLNFGDPVRIFYIYDSEATGAYSPPNPSDPFHPTQTSESYESTGYSYGFFGSVGSIRFAIPGLTIRVTNDLSSVLNTGCYSTGSPVTVDSYAAEGAGNNAFINILVNNCDATAYNVSDFPMAVPPPPVVGTGSGEFVPDLEGNHFTSFSEYGANAYFSITRIYRAPEPGTLALLGLGLAGLAATRRRKQ